MHSLTDKEKAFALALARSPQDPFRAALSVFGEDTASALQAAQLWAARGDILAEMNSAIERRGEDSFLPSKAEFSRLIWDRMANPETDNKDFAILGKLYADVRGFIQKGDTQVIAMQQKVMLVRDHGSDEEWEIKLDKQQRALINGEYSVN